MYYNRCPRHRKRYCITIIFMFDQEEDYYFAYSYPYTYSDLQAYLDHLDYRHRVQGLLHHDTAGATSSRKHRNNNDIHNHNHSNSHSHSQNCIRDNGKMVKPYYSRELLTRTIQQRRLDMLVITDIDNLRVLQKVIKC